MWHGNPVLTAVLFGLPLGFLTLICYSICCSDIMDADDDEEEGNFLTSTFVCSVNRLQHQAAGFSLMSGQGKFELYMRIILYLSILLH
jgi:hypothetical protein